MVMVAALIAACAGGSLPPEPVAAGVVWRSTGSVWEAGPLDVTFVDVSEGSYGAPRPLRIHAPVESGTYPVVQFQHGFTADIRTYDTMLSHVASHGFIVVAPQIYPADGIPLGKPTAADEALGAEAVARWSLDHAAAVVGSADDGGALLLTGHSRGGKVAWLTALGGRVPVLLLVGVDPVDGRGSFLLSAQPEALPTVVAEGPPSVIIGMGLAGPCAPQGDDYRHFFDRTPSPSTLFVVSGHAHGDMLDDEVDSGPLCGTGPARAAARATVAGVMTAALRAAVQGDEVDAEAAAVLASGAGAPVEVSREAR